MDKSREDRIQYLLDRQDIVDAIHRLSRGLDRADRELAISAYHEDGIDDHGIVVLPAAEFVDWALRMHAENHISHTHAVTNITADIDGDVAHVESYHMSFCENKVKPDTIASGRYVDRFERRDGKWAIALRVCISESLYEATPLNAPAFITALKTNGPAERSRRDVSYERPLTLKRPMQGGATAIA